MQDIESPEHYQEKMHQILKEAAAQNESFCFRLSSQHPE